MIKFKFGGRHMKIKTYYALFLMLLSANVAIANDIITSADQIAGYYVASATYQGAEQTITQYHNFLSDKEGIVLAEGVYAEAIGNWLAEDLRQRVSENKLTGLEHAFTYAKEKFSNLKDLPNNCGTKATALLLGRDHVVLGNVGDIRTILVKRTDNKPHVLLSSDNKRLSRFHFRPQVRFEKDINMHPINPQEDLCLIIGTQSLFSGFNENDDDAIQQVVKQVREAINGYKENKILLDPVELQLITQDLVSAANQSSRSKAAVIIYFDGLYESTEQNMPVEQEVIPLPIQDKKADTEAIVNAIIQNNGGLDGRQDWPEYLRNQLAETDFDNRVKEEVIESALQGWGQEFARLERNEQQDYDEYGLNGQVDLQQQEEPEDNFGAFLNGSDEPENGEIGEAENDDAKNRSFFSRAWTCVKNQFTHHSRRSLSVGVAILGLCAYLWHR